MPKYLTVASCVLVWAGPDRCCRWYWYCWSRAALRLMPWISSIFSVANPASSSSLSPPLACVLSFKLMYPTYSWSSPLWRPIGSSNSVDPEFNYFMFLPLSLLFLDAMFWWIVPSFLRMKLEFRYPTSHMHQILYVLNKSQVVPHPLYLSHIYTISSPPQPMLVLHNATALLRSFQWCLSSIGANLNSFASSTIRSPLSSLNFPSTECLGL